MKMSKKLLAITLASTALLAMFAMLPIPAAATEFIDVDDYCWIEGVLDSDTYLLYPYARKSVDFGFSKYGEMIGYNEDTEIGLGIQYPGYTGAACPDAPAGTYDQQLGSSVDPFCNEEIAVDWWMNGWFIDIKYTPLGGEADREIWAFALFSDGSSHGGDWIVMPSVSAISPARPLWQEHPPYANPLSAAYSGIVDPIPETGGRKTNGHCETDPIEIIYNGPRKFVAVCRTEVGDVAAAADLVDITFTFIFNKVEKNVIVLKDVKRLYQKSDLNVQFGNRGEWDLGISPDTGSYIHWYTDEPVQYWDLGEQNRIITCDEEAESFEFFKSYFLEFKTPKKWWDEVPASERPTKVCDEWTETLRDFPGDRYTDDISWNETQETCYGREWHFDETIKEHSYAVAQVIAKAGDYVGALAVWPHPEFWAAHNKYYPPLRTRPAGLRGGTNPSSIGLMLAPISRMLEWHEWTVEDDPTSDEYPEGYMDDREDIWVKMDDIVTPSGGTDEPKIPFTIYEHDFELSDAVPTFRIVSVYTVTDRHDADDRDALRGLNDEDWSDGINQIDREIQYQLDEIFDPWDIYDAMHKNTKRWVQFFDSGVETCDTPWESVNIKAWNGKDYHSIELDSERTIESGLTIPTLPVYPGEEPGVRPDDWDDEHGLCWDAYCAFTERVLVDTGTGYELIPRAVGQGILAEPDDDMKPSDLTSYNFLDPTPSTTRHYYTINFITGRICFYEYNPTTEVFEEWYLPEDSVVKVSWSSEHHATTAEQWDENDPLYPINNITFRFPLHHDIMPKYKDLTEVFLIEQPPERLPDTDPGGGLPFYTWSAAARKTLRVDHVPVCKEVDVKYYSYTGVGSWHEEKFHCDNADIDTFTLSYDAAYIEKVWIHSEKALTGGDYVLDNSTNTGPELYMQDPVPDCEWLIVNYTSGGYNYSDFFHGDGETTAFTLTAHPQVGTLKVNNTETLQQIINTTDSNDNTRAGLGIAVPRTSPCVWTNDPSVTSTYRPKTWERAGTIWEEREWLNVTDTKIKGNYIIRERPKEDEPYEDQPEGDYFSTCDELILNQPPLNSTQTETEKGTGWPGEELKIVFKVPSGRWEWGTVGTSSAPVDSIGLTTVVAAFKNKLMEFGLGGLDIQDSTYGPRVPWMVTGTSPDSIGRNHLRDDWCSYYETAPEDSWPISSSNIITAGGTFVNEVTDYFHDFSQVLSGTTVGDGYYAVTCWDKDLAGMGSITDPSGFYEGGLVTDRFGYAVISTYKDKNGTIGFKVHGWTGQDTYYAAKWFDEYKFELQHINLHVTDLILRIEYKSATGVPHCPPEVDIMEKLGTISEKPQHDC